MTEERRRSTDPLIEELIHEVKGFREDMRPIREFMQKVDAAKMASMWILGVIVAMGATIKWIASVWADIHPKAP